MHLNYAVADYIHRLMCDSGHIRMYILFASYRFRIDNQLYTPLSSKPCKIYHMYMLKHGSIVGMTEICQELRSHLLAQGLLNPVISFPIMEGVQCRCQYSTVQYSTVSVSILNRQLHN